MWPVVSIASIQGKVKGVLGYVVFAHRHMPGHLVRSAAVALKAGGQSRRVISIGGIAVGTGYASSCLGGFAKNSRKRL